MATFSDRTASSVVGVPALNNDTNDFSWAGGSTNAGNVIPPTPEPNLVKRFVLVRSNGVSAYSSDASSWTQSATLPLSPSAAWSDIVYANNKFVAVGRGSCAFSTDGLDWTSGLIDVSSYDRSVAYGNGKFVAISQGAGSREVFVSTDGVDWEKTSFNLWSNYGSWAGLAFGNGKFVTVENQYNQTAVSEDGISWSTNFSLSNTGLKTNVAYGDGKFVFLGKGTQLAYYSTDGLSWNTAPFTANSSWESVAYGDGKFVAVASGTNIMAYSEDGVSWSVSNLPSTGVWTSLIYANNRFVLIGQNEILVSSDGLSWTAATNPIAGPNHFLAYGEWQQSVI
jgi:hypothetical protein